MDFYIPNFTDSYLKGQDILFTQFNNIEFYIEDTEQENLYHHILKKLFPDIKFSKIFPLNGKTNVINECKFSNGNKKKVYIVDKDFDDILECVEQIENLFYLKSYSIENLLISKKALYELIKEKEPKLKDKDIDLLYSHDEILNSISCLKEISTIFVVIQQQELGEPYYKINTFRDFDITTDFKYKGSFIEDYKNKVESVLKDKDKRLTLQSQIKKHKKHFRSKNKQLTNIPGKHLLVFINDLMKSKNLIQQYSLESFTYKLGKECDIKNFNELKNDIESFVKG